MAMTETAMAAEIRETPEATNRFLDREGGSLAALGPILRKRDPRVIVTCARGSSDNAAAYFKYLCEILLGIPVASMGPSVASLYKAPLRLAGSVVLSVSQSGAAPTSSPCRRRRGGRARSPSPSSTTQRRRSPPRPTRPCRCMRASRRASRRPRPSWLPPLALAALVAEWRDDETLRRAVRGMPATFEAALAADWTGVDAALGAATSAYVLGRGPALPIAAEAALKLKETAVLHAEAFSGAEVMHGPLQLVGSGFPVVAFHPRDDAYDAMEEAILGLTRAGGQVYAAEAGEPTHGRMSVPASGAPLLDPLVMLLAFYGVAERVARARGHDPDRPTKLRKVTETM